ncbi:TetR/AcrR family transcriptional regulator [Thermomonospora umbrina]|uniref:TetR family transcriptional regulator n=1 Tax=Thermomonospora umbrina TaxID=111806 RepID=A0A3D9SY01_9ACTN|nr:TetR/AcrR family transcriptional regulator [Thermomonospora umbrina]REE99380.1 TetR family transcriptional regulator [Thermomonospora umbrina]
MGLFDGLLHRARTSEPADDHTAERVLDAALQQAEDFGLRRFTIDDVARRVGLSRVTIYRHFPKKDSLLSALVMRELRRFLSKAETVVDAQPTSAAKLTEGLHFCVTFLREHRLLNRLLRTEPELILPYLTTRAAGPVAEAREWIAGLVRAEITAGRIEIPDPDIDSFAELLVRIVLSLVLTPETVLPIEDDAERRRVIDLYFIPLTQRFTPTADSRPATAGAPTADTP